MIKAGVVGLGKMGKAHLNWIMNSPDMQLVALCEKNNERAKMLSEEYSVDVFANVDEFLLSNEMDMVVIVTTNEAHEFITIKALDAGKDAIVEKPMSITYESTKKMIAAAEKNRKKIFVHQSSRWDRDYNLVKETIESGRIGKLLSIKSSVMLFDEGWPSWGIDGMANPWRIKLAYGGGMLLDWGAHLVDQYIQLFGKHPKGVYGKLQNGIWSQEVDDAFIAMLDFNDSIQCEIECSNNAGIPLPRWYVVGTNGTLMIKGKAEPFWGDAILKYKDSTNNVRIENIEMLGIKESGMEGGFYTDLARYVKGELDCFVDMYDASEVVKTLEMIRMSSKEGRYVEWNEL